MSHICIFIIFFYILLYSYYIWVEKSVIHRIYVCLYIYKFNIALYFSYMCIATLSHSVPVYLSLSDFYLPFFLSLSLLYLRSSSCNFLCIGTFCDGWQTLSFNAAPDSCDNSYQIFLENLYSTHKRDEKKEEKQRNFHLKTSMCCVYIWYMNAFE